MLKPEAEELAMGLCLLLLIVIRQSVSLVDGPWLGNNEGHAEITFIKPTLQETSFNTETK